MAKKETTEEVVENNDPAPEAEVVESTSLDQGPAQNTPGLDIQDLQTASQIISVCTARGAFKAEEMEQVGKLFNKLNNFLQAAANATQQQAPGE